MLAGESPAENFGALALFFRLIVGGYRVMHCDSYACKRACSASCRIFGRGALLL